jgi:hypothetical protein
MSFIPYSSPKGTVDLTTADAEYRKGVEAKMDRMRRIVVRWVPIMQEITRQRPESHWCAYDDGRVVMFINLETDESFGDLEDLYSKIGDHVSQLQRLGSYKGKFTPAPDHEDDTSIGWRKWTFHGGDDSRLELNCSFYMSQHCRIVDDGEETQVVVKKRVVCEQPELSRAA